MRERLLGGQALALHPHLGRDRAGVPHVLVVVDLVAALEVVEVAGQQRVTVEIEQATLFGQQESEILLRRDLGNLTQRLVFGIVVADLVRPSRCCLRSSSCRSAMRNASLMALCKSGCWYLRSKWSGSWLTTRSLRPGIPSSMWTTGGMVPVRSLAR